MEKQIKETAPQPKMSALFVLGPRSGLHAVVFVAFNGKLEKQPF